MQYLKQYHQKRSASFRPTVQCGPKKTLSWFMWAFNQLKKQTKGFFSYNITSRASHVMCMGDWDVIATLDFPWGLFAWLDNFFTFFVLDWILFTVENMEPCHIVMIVVLCMCNCACGCRIAKKIDHFLFLPSLGKLFFFFGKQPW